jgi:hypothetical protein
MRILTAFVLLLAVIPLASKTTAQVASEKPPFTITISTPQATVKAGLDVKVEATMTNTSDQDVSYAVGVGPIINVDVRDAEGKPVSETPEGRKIHGTDRRDGPGGVLTVIRIPLKPGKTLAGESILSKEYDLSKPGKYTVQAHRFDGVSMTMVKSNTITLTVTP